MTGPGDERAAGSAGRGRLRASHADPEQVIGILKAAFVQGMLDKDEFDLRVGQAFASRSSPRSPPTSPPGWPQPSRRRPPGRRLSSQLCGSARRSWR